MRVEQIPADRFARCRYNIYQLRMALWRTPLFRATQQQGDSPQKPTDVSSIIWRLLTFPIPTLGVRSELVVDKFVAEQCDSR